MAAMSGVNPATLEEERLRKQEESVRRLREERDRKAQEEADKKAAAEAERATQASQEASAAPAAAPDPAHTGVRSRGLPKVTRQDKLDAQFMGDVRQSVLDTPFGVVGENYVAERYKPEWDREQQRKNYAGAMAGHASGLYGNTGKGNEINVDLNGFKSEKQAFLFASTLTSDADKAKLIKDYAKANGIDENEAMVSAEKYMRTTYNRDMFKVPQTDGGKIRAANNALGAIGLTDIGGNALDIANSTPQLTIQALRMNPDPSVHEEAWKAIQVLQKTQGSKWYGMDLKKSDFGFLDSPDLTQSQYNEQAKSFATRFVFADSENEQNKAAYLRSVQEINAKYGGNKRVHDQMLSLLNKTFEERNPGVSAPDAAAVDAFMKKQAEAVANDPNVAADEQNWLEKVWNELMSFFGKKEKTDEPDSTLDSIIEQNAKSEQEAMDGMLSIDKDGKTTYHGATGDVVIGNATVAPEATEPEVQGPQMPASKTASGSNNLASAANANDIGGLGLPPGTKMYANAAMTSGVNFVPGAKNVGEPTAVDRMLAADQPSIVSDQNATLAYDPNMSDEAAMLAWSRGQDLDPRNKAQIKNFIGDDEWLSTYRACQRGYANTDMFGGDLTDYEKSTVSSWVKYGKRIGAAMMGLKTEGLNPEIQTLGSMMVANLVKEMNAYISDPNNGFVGGGAQQYDALIEQFPDTFGAQVNEIKGLWAKQIEAEKADLLENKKENAAMAEAYTQQAIDGAITADGIAWLALNEDDEVTENVYNAAMEDDSYVSAVRDVSGGLFGGGFWKDEKFWAGDSAVATEMRNVETIGGKKAAKEYKNLLGEVMKDTYLSLSIDAHQVNKTMSEYLNMVELTPGDVADLSLMKMISSGTYVLNHPEAQQALDTISIGRWNAAALGFEAGAKKAGEGFVEGAQIIATEANRDRYAFEIYNKFNSEFGQEFAPREVRKALIGFANSGVLSEESKAELMYALEHGDDIYNVAASYMEHDGFTAFLDNSVNDLQKDMETIDVLISSLSDDEKSVANTMKSTGNTLVGMGIGIATTAATGSPFLGALAQNTSGWADTMEYYNTQKGANRGDAAFNATMLTLSMAAANTMGMSDWMDDMFGAKGYYNVLKRAAIKNPGTFVQNLATATKYGVVSGAQAYLTEGFEGGMENVVEGTYEKLYDTVKAETEAINRGEGASFFRPLMNFTNAIVSTDPIEAGKEFLTAAGAEGAMGAVMRVATNIITTPFALGGASKTRQFKSTSMALRMYDGELPMTEENIGKFALAFKQDCENPDFVGYMNKVNQHTQDQKNVAMAILDGTAEPERKAAVELANQAEIYHKDADAARSAADESKGTYMDLRSRVINGEVDAVPALNEARDKWTRAETAFKEADGAWKKTAAAATEKVKLFYSAVREASTGVKSQELGLLATRMLDAQKILAQQVVVKTEAEMKAEAEAEAAIAAEAETVDVMTDEELDADIAQMLESENTVAAAEAEAEEMGYDEETLNALAEQNEADQKKNAAHKEAIVRNQRNSYESLTARMQQAQELEDTDAYNELGKQRSAVQARLEALGVTLDQETNAPEPSTETAAAKPASGKAVAPKATTPVSPEPSTTTPAARPADPKAVKRARYDEAKDLVTGTTKEQREAEAREAQEAANVGAMDVEAYIEARYPNASESGKQHIRDIYNEDNASGQPEPKRPVSAVPNDKKLEASNAIKFAGQVKRRFGVAVEIVDPAHKKLALKSGKYASAAYDRDTDTIYVSSKATQGDVIRAKVVHELTHRTENTGAYKEFSQAVKGAYFNGNAKNEESVRNKIRSLYKKNGVELTPDGLEQEVVAYATEKLIGGDQDMVNRIVSDSPSVARRILDAISNVLSKMTGVKTEEVSQLKSVEKMFKKALNEAASKNKASSGGVQYAANWDEDIEPDELTKYNGFGWIRKNGVMSASEWRDHNSRLKMYSDAKNTESLNADGNVLLQTRDDNGDFGLITVSDNNPTYPEIYRVYRIKWRDEPYWAEEAEKEILESEQRWGYDAQLFAQKYVELGAVEIYGAQNYRAYKLDEIPGRVDSDGETSDRNSEIVQDGRGSYSEAGRGGSVNDGNVQLSIDDSSLPDDEFLREEIAAWKNDTSYLENNAPAEQTGKRQFATKTIQQNEYVPDYIKQTFLNDPTRREYSRESNMGQLTRAWNRVQKEGYEGVRDRLLNQEGKFDADDNADALVLMSTAMQYDDMDTFMSIATKYNAEGTEQGHALQIRSLMKKMTPTGFAQKVVKDVGKKLEAHMETHKAESRNIARQSKKIEDSLHLRDLDGTSAADRLMQGESVRIDNKWGAPLNEQKDALIKEFGLGKAARPGVFYNWATTKQRMLEDILTTDDVFARDSNGMNLVDRLIRMKHGHPVVTKADIAYITEQMNIFNSLDDKSSREADLALSRAYEAQGNITPATGKEKRKTWRYTSMLLSLASATRNVIGNTAQSIPNAIADGIAVELDRAISLATGRERTRAHISAADRIKGWRAFTEETKNTFRDYFIDKTITQHGEGRYNQNQRGRVFETQTLEALRNMEGLLMSVGDRNFWKKKFFNSLAEQQRIAEENGVEFDIDEATEIAEAEANYATFNEDNAVRSAFTSLKNAPIIGPVLDYIMPFTGVPTNIVKRQIEFSPIGLAYTAFKHGMGALNGNDFDQRAFVNGMARGLTGSALMAVGAVLLKEGVLKLGTKEEDDEKIYNLRSAQGDQYGVYFTIGDKNYSISTFSPAASAFVAGAFVADALGDNERWYQAIINGTLKNVNEILDASYMSSLSDLLNTSNGQTVVDNIIPTVGNSLLTQNIPAPVSHLASSLDPYVRDTKDKDALMAVVKTTMSKIPGLRETLNEKNDITGKAIENTKYGAAAFVDPFTTSKINDDPALKELKRIQEKTGSSSHIPTYLIKNSGKHTILAAIADGWDVNMDRSIGEHNLVLDADERNHYNQLYGQLAFEGTGDKYYRTVGSGVEGSFTGIYDYMNSYDYTYATDEERAKEIEKIIKKAKLLTQAQIVIDKGYTIY